MSGFTSPMLELCTRPGDMAKVTKVMLRVVAKSFLDDKSTPTTNEMKRRCDMCIDLFRIMRRDCGWSLIRCMDNLDTALRAKLDGAPWEPSKKNAWSPAEDSSQTEIWTPERARLGIVE